ncbi:MAG: hypothetical protein R3195_00715 [Gemmatimonadota bacterium]|nr:hypothetical protein [Gemmatimonadota bacterium]
MRRDPNRRTIRWAATVLATGAALTAAAVVPTGTAAQEIDAGRLEVHQDGRRVAIESFRVWEAGANLNAGGSIEPVGNSGGEFQVGVALDAQLRPVRYELRGPGARVITGAWSVDRVRLHTITDEGERWRELASRGAGSVLEVGVAHHHLVLVRVLEGGGGRATVVVPLRGEAVDAQLVGQRSDEVTIDGRGIAATRYDLRIGGSQSSVWVDAEGRLLRVVDGSSGLEAIRLAPG